MCDATEALVATFRSFGEGALRDVWVFDQWTHQKLYSRDDVEDRLDNCDVAGFIDNERYGYITRDTYESLYYADYKYTVRGFSSFELFRTFFADDDGRVGVIASFDHRESGYDFATLSGELQTAFEDHSVAEFVPDDAPDGDAR
ncbi:hypothetical protein SAMN04487948_1282 [Halogranum amylolyticum]|uniref:Uncharacterized protein n=1 Tax=Halogranum amylolyticum TaxID=660520 RepID=A0A1H8WDT4_9EURY|nr:hypothetical protein [Halogranum amylolyticum]SEP25781.1 hypothetical protein SAMN04487948_1282 [Halogranum amylolyticum]